jgi:drug/metabolite transporter (DMT)-like permease
LLLVTFLIPVSAILLGAAFQDEHLEAGHFAGMALIGLGLLLIETRFMVLWQVPSRPAK